MAATIAKLKQRFIGELPLWRLSFWQFLLLLLWASWPWLAQWAFPGNPALAFGPVFISPPFAYLVGSLFMALLPGCSQAYALGVSFTIFLLAYLGLVSWRQAHARKHQP